MLFSNRRLAGNAESEIRAHISKECGIPESSLYLCGVEQIELFLKVYHDIPALADLDPIDSPLLVSPDDLAEVVQALARQRDDIFAVIDSDAPVERTSYAQKNQINNMTASYATALRRQFLKETRQIDTFLASPENRDLLELYQSVTEEFQLKIIAKRKDYQTFDEVMEYLLDLLFGRDPVLRQRNHKRLTRVMLFYMYWSCDIGEVPDVEAN
jgi:hypothetical protein